MARCEAYGWWLDEHGHLDKLMAHLRGHFAASHLFGLDASLRPKDDVVLNDAHGFRCLGSLEGREFTVGVFWGGELGEQTVIRGAPTERRHVVAFVEERCGSVIPVGGTGDVVDLHLNSPLSIRAALAPWGHLISVAGDDPPGWPRSS